MRLTQERLKELLDYDPLTGVFLWRAGKVARGTHRRAVGQAAGCTVLLGCRKGKYTKIVADGRGYLAHNLAWLYMTGEWPSEIDHRDLVGTNNRWTNLRKASHSQNMTNRPLFRNNTSGFKGVSRSGKKWQAVIMKNRVSFYLGKFEKKEDARDAYLMAAGPLHGEFARAG